MNKTTENTSELLGIIIKLAFMITLFILVYNTNKRTKIIEQRTKVLYSEDLY